MDHDKNPAPPDESASDTPPAKGESTSEDGSPSIKELLAAARGEVTKRETPPTKTTLPPKTPPVAGRPIPKAPAPTPRAPAVDATPPKTEVPAATPPAARVAPGAAKSTSTPTAAVTKGIPKAAAARASAPAGPVVQSTTDTPVNKLRRRIIWASIVAFLGTSLAMFLRFFLPRTIFEPSSVFRIGFPGDYNLGVDTKWQQQYRIWVDKTTDRLFVIYARCTHLGCTPDWRPSENKFKCPCHGSGYDSDGINFEGPAPRPMDRAHVELDAEGQIVVNVGKLYKQPKGERSEFNDEGAYIQV